MTVLTIPTAVDSAQVGQANLLFAALMLHAAADVARRHWWGAALVLSMLIVEKPFGLVMILLVAALDGPMRWRLAAGLAASNRGPRSVCRRTTLFGVFGRSWMRRWTGWTRGGRTV